jgi:hypothetical protein
VCKPFRVSTDVNHRHGCTTLQKGDQFEQECCRGLCQGAYRMAAAGIAAIHPMSGDTAYIKAAFRLSGGKCVQQGLTQARIPFAFERQQSPENIGQGLRRM